MDSVEALDRWRSAHRDAVAAEAASAGNPQSRALQEEAVRRCRIAETLLQLAVAKVGELPADVDARALIARGS